MLTIDHLRAGYDGRAVLTDASLHVRPGETAALLGLNGSGKSTLLRAALGLLPAQAGRVTLAGRDLLAMRPRERARLAAYVPQRSGAPDGLTALEVVLMGANPTTPPFAPYSARQREHARMCLAQLGAQDWADVRMGTLSQGQRRLVILARALMQQPRALLLDEPDASLDLPNRYAVMALVRAQARQRGCAALAALHDAALALNTCDRVWVLQAGVVSEVLCMESADAQDIRRALTPLYGAIRVLGAPGGWAVLPADDTPQSAVSNARE